MNSPRFNDDVAIVGYAYRMPGGIRTDDDFWRLLSQREIVQEPVTDRYGRGYRPVGGFSGSVRFASPFEGLIRDDGEKLFDRGLFGLSQHEMLSTDPQLRMLLMCAWDTCERSGWELHSLRNSLTGVFVGAQTPPVANWRPLRGAGPFDVTSISLAMLANRISYHFNLMGPSTTYCTACSASLTALNAAMNALRCGDCEQAIVGSVNYLGTARLSAAFNALGVISPDGKCHSFDAEANGYMRSEGTFVFAIKPLEAAERDGDPIHAVVEATAVNAAGAADGSSGLAQGRYITAPTRHAQADLMRLACARSGRQPREFDYIEAHATGTVVGDRIEGNAITEAFSGTDREVPLRISSVKSNVGHMEAAAFHCALLKVVLMMQRRNFAPISKNYLVPNPEIDFERCPMQVQTTCEPFPEPPVVVGINSFGFGGANGHCVVREYRPAQPRLWSVGLSPEAGHMIPLSARTSGLLTRSARQLREALVEQEMDLYTLAGNLSRRRTHFAARTSFAVRNRQELVEALDAFIQDPAPVATVDESERRVALVFAGQGTQWAGCGRTLYDADPVFRRVIDAIEEHWREHSDRSLRHACFSAGQEELDEVRLAQPVIFTIQCALVELLKTWGVHADCVVGHSSGEVAAAYACGALSLADATRLVFHRATLQQRVAGSGRMLAVGLDRAGLEDMLETLRVPFRSDQGPTRVEIACENAPANTVICGKEAALRPIMAELDRRNLQNQLLPGNIAFHSTAMDPIKDDALAALSFLNAGAFDAEVPFVSSVTGEQTRRLDNAYWWSNIRRPVRFAAAMETIQRKYRPDVVLEIAPHSALQTTIAQCLDSSLAAPPACIPTLMRDGDVCLGFNQALGALFMAGIDLDFAAQYPRPEPVAHLLPGHPREEQATMDIMCDNEMFVRQGEYSHGPLVGHKVPSDHLLFEARLSEKDFPWLADHRVHHAAIMPGAGYIELVLEALGGVPACLEVIEFLQPCPIPERSVRLQTALHPVATATDEWTFTISSRRYEVDAKSELHCRGKVRLVGDDQAVAVPCRLADIDRTHFKPSFLADDRNFYERLEAVLSETFQYGPYFRTIQRVLVDTTSKAYLFDVEMDEGLWTTGREEGYVSCPPLFDGALQIFLYHLLTAADLFAIPQRAEGVTFFRPPSGPRITCHVTRPRDDWMDANERGQYSVRRGERAGGSLSLYDSATGDLVAHIGEYTYFTSNPRWNDLPESKHRISWQPKFIPAGQQLADRLPEGEIGPAALIAALERPEQGQPYACHVVEFAGCREPEQTLLDRCIDHLSNGGAQTEFWLVADTEESTRAHYDAFGQRDAALRFERLDPAAQPRLDAGLLRPGSAEIIFLHGDGEAVRPEEWKLARRLAVAGGLALVSHGEGEVIGPVAGWTVVRAGRRKTLLQAPQSRAEPPGATEPPGPRWVLGEPGSWASDWVDLLDAPDAHPVPDEAHAANALHLLETWPGAADLRAIDFFCGEDPEDPTGEKVVSRFVAFVQALVSYRMENANHSCRLTVATRGTVLDVDDPRGSALWGAVRSMAVEIDEEARIDFRLVDLGDSGDLEAMAWLARCDLRERELAVRENRLWAPRWIDITERYSRVSAPERIAYRLALDNPGQIAGLEMKTFELPALGPDDVEIEVTAAALNFRDVMVTLGLLPALAYERSALGREVGMEGSGIVRRVGSEVRGWGAGDEVAFIQGGCIANRAVVNQYLVFAKPDRLSMEEAASVLSVHVTAYYSLIHLARLRKGQRVLIHSAMGGVGQAAIALAKHVGAEIYATAGSEDKREQLLSLGVRAAFDSHSHAWHDDLMAATEGEGVDVVLNSLAGRHVELCLQALRPGGWHCEIGKVDIYRDNDLGLRIFRKNLRFAAIDVDRLMIDDPLLSRQLSQVCLDLLDQGALPPLPVTVFPFKDYARALRLMTSGRHQGKLVLKAPEAAGEAGFTVADVRPFLDPEATYLVTGGLGGFGLRLLPYLVAAGARHITLMDRDPERRRDAEWVRHSSALVYMDEDAEFDILSGDVAVEEDVRRCVSQLERPLKGVFHLAGALDDRLLDDLSAESVATVFAPKAHGALHLHRATEGCPLDAFVLFSSTASALGNPGQINYSAANAFLDGFAAWRRRQGLPCLSYNMAAVADAGMAARSLPVLRMMRAAGLPPVSSDFAIANLDYALRAMSDRDHLITALFKHPAWTIDYPDYMRIGRLMNNQDAFKAGVEGELTLESVVAQIAAKVAELCGHEEDDVEEPLASFGLTSISVAELGTFIQTQFNYRVSALELMTTASCLSLARGIIHGKENVEDDVAEADTAVSEGAALVAQQRARRAPSVFANAIEDHFPPPRDVSGRAPESAVRQRPRAADLAMEEQGKA